MLDLRQQAVPTALVVVLLCAVAVELVRSTAPAAAAHGGQGAEAQIISPGEGQAACPLVCDADGDGLLDALLLSGSPVVTSRLVRLWFRVHRQPSLLAGRSVPPLPPPPRLGG